MHVHILGICGTFMGSLAVLAKQLGHDVSGSDANVYPPMSTQLEQQGIELIEGFDPSQLHPAPDLVVVGNAMSRGNPCVEHVLNSHLDYCSGPEWLARYVLKEKWVLGVAGTHGKTTTSSMLTWILEYAGLKPGYLIGGVAKNFTSSASLGDSIFFVVEADEYDSAFFDKRSKFVHYAPRTAILNNLEFDHADIFDDLDAIKKQFHHLIRTIPGNGLILTPAGDKNLQAVLDQGCWSQRQQYTLSPNTHTEACWQAVLLSNDGSHFAVKLMESDSVGQEKTVKGTVTWNETGEHSVNNALAAIAAARHVGVEVETACAALSCFEGVKRRMELRGEARGIKVYDDFAHHPTAIATTLDGMAKKLSQDSSDHRLIAVIEPRSNTMRMGVHQRDLVDCCKGADIVYWLQPPSAGIKLQEIAADFAMPCHVFNHVDDIVAALTNSTIDGDNIIIMSNGGFGGIHEKLLSALGMQ